VCYSLSVFSDVRTLVRRFGCKLAQGVELPKRYYVSGFTFPAIPVIASDAPFQIRTFRWGLIPSWIQSAERARRIRSKTLNARYETLRQRPSFKDAFDSRRCLVLVDGFFETHQVEKTRYPYFIHHKDAEPFALAGVWDRWRNPSNGKEEETFSIVTVPANSFLAEIHNTKRRMPLILDRAAERKWLERPLGRKEVGEMMRHFDERVLDAFPVARELLRQGGGSGIADLLKPYEYPELKGR